MPPRKCETLLWQHCFPGLSLKSIIYPKSNLENKYEDENAARERGKTRSRGSTTEDSDVEQPVGARGGCGFVVLWGLNTPT